MKILLVSDIHGNFPALKAVDKSLHADRFDLIINSGDSTVYAPFPNRVLERLRELQVVSILGNTDRKIIKLLKGKSFKKPSKPEKRIMYTSTAEALTLKNRKYLQKLPQKKVLKIKGKKLGIFHGSPEHTDEFLFAATPDSRFRKLAANSTCDIIITGHSHTPYHKKIGGVDFINPGSTGRMFDGDPRLSCAVLKLKKQAITVRHYRISYDVDAVVQELARQHLPEIYAEMYIRGKKLN